MESPEHQRGGAGGTVMINNRQEKENLCRVFHLWFGGLQPRVRVCISQFLFGGAVAEAAARCTDVGRNDSDSSAKSGLLRLEIEAVGSGKPVCSIEMDQNATVKELFAKLATHNGVNFFLGHGGPEIKGDTLTLGDAGLKGDVPITMLCVPCGPGSVRVAKMPIRRHGAVMVAEDTLKKLGLFVGDVVCLTSFNGKTTKAIVVLESDLPEKTIRADKELRVNLDVSVGSWITISEQEMCVYATAVTILPFADSLKAAGIQYAPEEMTLE
eukprot:INCI14087.2.p1 GENE.INCI14087.2~~INCI14087.2.p1  ORF type:complete len:269 (-),score=51.72 INCI14087.2:534-1340(-)